MYDEENYDRQLDRYEAALAEPDRQVFMHDGLVYDVSSEEGLDDLASDMDVSVNQARFVIWEAELLAS